jgi:rubrerythrin
MKLEKLYNVIQDKLTDETYANREALSRRDAFKKAGDLGIMVAAATIPLAFATMNTKKTYSQPRSGNVVDVLNFALTLEYLEAKFYNMGLAANVIAGGDIAVFQQISNHENDHVTVLKSFIQQLGGTPVAEPTFDFTAGGTYADVFTNYQTFLALSQAFEDTGVRAYKGQAGALQENDAALTAALQIHSVEARHASEVRRIRGNKGWVVNADPTGLPAAIYVREDNVMQGGVDVRTITTVSAQSITEAFDETLTMAEVLAIADPFIV